MKTQPTSTAPKPKAAVQTAPRQPGPAPTNPLAQSRWIETARLVMRWILFRTIRQAGRMRRHVWKLLNAQRDLLPPQSIQALQTAMDALRRQRRVGSLGAVRTAMQELEQVANRHLKPYPFPAWRENVEVLLVAIAVAMGIRTFFLQPFKIPTGSMQPTLFGITDKVLGPEDKIPNRLVRFFDYWINGVSFVHVVAKAPGELRRAEPPVRLVLFNLRQRFQVGEVWYTVWFPPEGLLWRAGLAARGSPDSHPVLLPRSFQAGEDIIKLRVVSGDHLFVDRLTYNFRRPRRGDIIVFETKHIYHPNVPQNQYYIKRLVALGGETVSINNDNRLVINGQPLTAQTPGFEKLYGSTAGSGSKAAGGYCGHEPVERFRDGQQMVVPKNHYLAMGDNTRNSLDSRYWGSIPREDVIGKAFFVYWPIGSANGRPSRFGLGYR